MDVVRHIVAVCGPTASGKSDLGMRLAAALNGEVVSVDSVQVFREADIGSAKVSPSDRTHVVHHLLDVLNPDEECNAAAFRGLALGAIDTIAGRGRVPVLTVGTTMYFTTLVHGLAAIPRGDSELREALDSIDSESLHARLKSIDPVRAELLNKNDRMRLIRAIESYELSGKTQTEAHAGHSFQHSSVSGVFIVLIRHRDDLYERIEMRSKKLVASGLISETEFLLSKYGPEISVLSSIGYREAMQVLRGELAPDLLADAIALATRRYAKRQMTFWRNEPTKRGWLTRPEAGDPSAVEVGKEGIKGKRSLEQARGFRVLPLDTVRLEAALREKIAEGRFEKPEVWYVLPEGF